MAQVFFSSQTYHAVYHHQPGRRVISHNFCQRHSTEDDLASLYRNNPGIFTVDERLLHHANPRVRALVSHGLAGAEHLGAAASRRMPYPEADISSYAEAKAHLQRHGMRSARNLFEAGELRWG